MSVNIPYGRYAYLLNPLNPMRGDKQWLPAKQAAKKRPRRPYKSALSKRSSWIGCYSPGASTGGARRDGRHRVSCPVVDDPEPRTRITLAVLEHGLSPAELPRYDRLEALVDRPLPGGMLHLTIPRSVPGDSITPWLTSPASARQM
jgi:hypothetical protein